MNRNADSRRRADALDTASYRNPLCFADRQIPSEDHQIQSLTAACQTRMVDITLLEAVAPIVFDRLSQQITLP